METVSIVSIEKLTERQIWWHQYFFDLCLASVIQLFKESWIVQKEIWIIHSTSIINSINCFVGYIHKYVQFFHQDILMQYKSVICVTCCELNFGQVLYAIMFQLFLFLTKHNKRRVICVFWGFETPFGWRDFLKKANRNFWPFIGPSLP